MKPKRQAFKNHPGTVKTQVTNRVSRQQACSTDPTTPLGCRIQAGNMTIWLQGLLPPL